MLKNATERWTLHLGHKCAATLANYNVNISRFFFQWFLAENKKSTIFWEVWISLSPVFHWTTWLQDFYTSYNSKNLIGCILTLISFAVNYHCSLHIKVHLKERFSSFQYVVTPVCIVWNYKNWYFNCLDQYSFLNSFNRWSEIN